MANVKAAMTDIRVIIREPLRGTSLREMERCCAAGNHQKGDGHTLGAVVKCQIITQQID